MNKDKGIDKLIKGSLVFEVQVSPELKIKTLEKIKKRAFFRKLSLIFTIFSAISFILSLFVAFSLNSLVIKVWAVVFQLQFLISVLVLIYLYRKYSDSFVEKFEGA